MNRFWKKKLPALLLALVMMVSLVPAASAASADFEFEVEPGEKVTFKKKDFQKFYEEEEPDETFGYLVFTDYDDLDDYGYLYAEVYDEDEDEFKWKKLDEDDLDNNVWFYYSSNKIEYDGDACLADLAFVADDDAEEDTLTLKFKLFNTDEDCEVKGTMEIEITEDGSGSSSSSSGKTKLTYEVKPNKTVSFDEGDFKTLFKKKVSGEDFAYMEFNTAKDMDDYGKLYGVDYEADKEIRIKEAKITDYWFFVASEADDEDFLIEDLFFKANDDADGETVTLTFTLYGEDDSEVDGTLYIEIGDVDSDDEDEDEDEEEEEEYDILFNVEAGDDVTLDRKSFKKFYEDEDLEDFSYVVFKKATNLDDYGHIEAYAYDEDDEDYYDVELDEDELLDGTFFYSDDDVDDEDDVYCLDDLTFVADKKTDGKVVTLEFTAYGEDKSDKVSGVVRIEIGEVETAKTETGSTKGNILYLSTYNTNVQLNANDFARYFEAAYPGSTMQYVKINGVPETGGLYYNYYGASSYGTTARTKLTASNCDDQGFYLSPSAKDQYALTELTYVPSGTNYCAPISFTAYGSGSRNVSGIVLISVSMKAIPEIYGVVPKNSSVSFPAPSIAAAVATGTSSTFSSIQLLSLPTSKQGTVYVGTGTTRKADTKTLYSYANSDTWQISQLRFVPASGYSGSVEIPYAVCDKSGTPLAVGKFCLGVVPSVKKFSDVTSSTWCYKYVTELASTGVIDGYADGTYKFNNTVTYGAALKLVMLAAGYPEQAPINSNVFSGYLAKAQAEGIVTRTNVNLSAPITRLQMAQLAAGALDLDTTNLSSIKPFTDTDSAHAQALNAAGIIEGYFSNGTSTYKPNNNLTRGQMSAIVWRMRNYVG